MLHNRESARHGRSHPFNLLGGWRSAVLVGTVLACTSLLAACPKQSSQDDPSVRAVKTQFSYISDQIRAYAAEHRRPPSQEDGLAVLFDGAVPKDPWGHPVVYESPGPNGIAFDLVSYGADGVPGGKKEATDLRWSELK